MTGPYKGPWYPDTRIYPGMLPAGPSGPVIYPSMRVVVTDQAPRPVIVGRR